jgi:hypothetical protein
MHISWLERIGSCHRGSINSAVQIQSSTPQKLDLRAICHYLVNKLLNGDGLKYCNDGVILVPQWTRDHDSYGSPRGGLSVHRNS